MLCWLSIAKRDLVTEAQGPQELFMITPCVLECGKTAAAEITTIRTPLVADHCFMTITAICAIDYTTQIATYIEIGIEDSGRLLPIQSKAGAFAANVSHTIDYPVVLKAGQRVYAKFATPTAGDQLALYAHGVVECLRPGGSCCDR